MPDKPSDEKSLESESIPAAPQFKMKKKTAFIVDDEEMVCRFVARSMRNGGFDVEIFSDGLQLLTRLAELEKMPDLIVTDINMPGISGIELARKIREFSEQQPLIAITGDLDVALYKDYFENGFAEVLEKPFDPYTLVNRARQVLENSQIPTYKKVTDVLVLALANMGDARDSLTQNHNLRIGEMCFVIASEMGALLEFTENIRLAARIHDIGKLRIKDSVLQKNGKLTDEEFAHIKTHTTAGAEMLKPVLEHLDTDYMRMAYEIILSHHEKLDGSGYPNGLKEPDIPIHVRITTVADIYDGVTIKRPYHDQRPHEAGMKVLFEEVKDGKLDPWVVAAFHRIEADIKEIKRIYSE